MQVDTRVEVCARCKLAQTAPVELPAGSSAACGRCGLVLGRPGWFRDNRAAAMFAVVGLILYVPGVTLPMLVVERFGQAHAFGLIDGVLALIREDSLWIGLLLLVCSVFLPIGKLLAMLVLSTRGLRPAPGGRAGLFALVEWTGRFGMLDVLLVAVLVAAVKMGDLVSVSIGPGLYAFTGVVLMSLAASWVFDADSIWDTEHDG